ncbi:hypothetical protein [Acidovorax sp. SDU_ACID1]|uniref:hypothetical protein n=1 Tax=Acidovorax sp. SDU_ACID1 TaxID=3136632 RepID=UPI00387370FE
MAAIRKNLDAYDALNAAVTKAHAMSMMTYGNAGECFRCMSNALQDEYLWALGDLLSDAVAALRIIDGAQEQKGGAA